MDESSDQLAAAHEHKLQTYGPLMEALQAYSDEGWQVVILPWVRSWPAVQCISSENPRLSLGAAAELEENYRRCGFGVSERILLSASASSGSQPWAAGQYYENQQERTRKEH